MLTNQCDWQSNVDCRFNKNPALLSPQENDHQLEPQVVGHNNHKLDNQNFDGILECQGQGGELPEYMDYAYEDRGIYYFK